MSDRFDLDQHVVIDEPAYFHHCGCWQPTNEELSANIVNGLKIIHILNVDGDFKNVIESCPCLGEKHLEVLQDFSGLHTGVALANHAAVTSSARHARGKDEMPADGKPHSLIENTYWFAQPVTVDYFMSHNSLYLPLP